MGAWFLSYENVKTNYNELWYNGSKLEVYAMASSILLVEDDLYLFQGLTELLQKSGYAVHNLDCTIVAERPKLAAFIPLMRENIAGVLELDLNYVSIKATTTEGLGFAGRKEGIAAYSVVTIKEL